MKYRFSKKGKPGDDSAPKKWYAGPVKAGQIGQKALAKEIAGRSSLTSGDVNNVIQNMIEVLPFKLIEGYSVQLEDFGTFRVSFSSEGVENIEDFNVEKIRGLKILFTPSPELKKALLNIKFEREG